MGSLQRIPRESLRSQVFHLLQTAIVSGDMRPGERLRDQELAERLGVSRTPVREALKRLEDEGLVETVPGSMTRVTPLESRHARDGFPVVAALHGLAARLAVSRLTVQDLTAMHEANDALRVAIESGETERAIEADDQFHGVMLHAADNLELHSALDRLMPKVRRLEFAQFGSLAGRASCEQHRAILLALSRGAAADAARLVEENWLSLGKLLVRSLEQDGEAAADDERS